MTTQETTQKKVLKIYNQIVSLKKFNVKVEFNYWANIDKVTAELVFYNGNELKDVLKLVSPLGVHKIVKGEYSSGGQYAEGYNKDQSLRVYVHPEKEAFSGCRVIKWTETREVPAKEAHIEKIEHTKIVCGESS